MNDVMFALAQIMEITVEIKVYGVLLILIAPAYILGFLTRHRIK